MTLPPASVFRGMGHRRTDSLEWRDPWLFATPAEPMC